MSARNLYQRLNAVQKKITYIQKEKKAGMRYSIVSHDAVTAKVRDPLVEEGVLYFPSNLRMEQVGNRTQCSMLVKFVNIDNPEDFIEVASAGYGIDDQDKGPGKAISYAVKYALLKALGLESGDDPDMDQETEYEDAVTIAIKEFENDVALAKTEEELRGVANAHKESMEHAVSAHPARVQAAKQKWQAKMAAVKKATQAA